MENISIGIHKIKEKTLFDSQLKHHKSSIYVLKNTNSQNNMSVVVHTHTTFF